MLFLIDLPYAIFWGLLAAVLRFVPYVGPWVAALMPTALGLAAFEGWIWPLVVIGLFVVLELFTNMVLEPLLYADSAGVSRNFDVALGPHRSGYGNALPFVSSCYVPQMEFIGVLRATVRPSSTIRDC